MIMRRYYFEADGAKNFIDLDEVVAVVKKGRGVSFTLRNNCAPLIFTFTYETQVHDFVEPIFRELFPKHYEKD